MPFWPSKIQANILEVTTVGIAQGTSIGGADEAAAGERLVEDERHGEADDRLGRRRHAGEEDGVPPGIPELLVADQRGVVVEADEIVGLEDERGVAEGKPQAAEDRIDRHPAKRDQGGQQHESRCPPRSGEPDVHPQARPPRCYYDGTGHRGLSSRSIESWSPPPVIRRQRSSRSAPWRWPVRRRCRRSRAPWRSPTGEPATPADISASPAAAVAPTKTDLSCCMKGCALAELGIVEDVLAASVRGPGPWRSGAASRASTASAGSRSQRPCSWTSVDAVLVAAEAGRARLAVEVRQRGDADLVDAPCDWAASWAMPQV